MLEKYNKWIKKFNELVDKELYEKAVEHFTLGFETAFSTPLLYEVYKGAAQIPNQYFKDSFSKLLLGWLAFASGDNKKVNWVLSSTNELDLVGDEAKANYYSLKAMVTFMVSQKEGLEYGKLALDMLSEDNKGFIAGNSYMTYGRQLTNINRFRDGAEYFNKAYEIFRSLESTFLALNCFVSECLNLYALGKCSEVIKKCQEALMLNSSHNSKLEEHMNIVKLPLGMCYFEMNKISLAIEALMQAKSGIVSLKLVHMHGLVEQYLFRCYSITKDEEKITNTLEKLEEIFKNLNYPQMEYLIMSMKIKAALAFDRAPKDEWIEKLELAYQINPKAAAIFILEILTELKLKGFSEIITIDILIYHLEKLRFEGHMPHIQSISLYLAELFYREKDIETMKVHLKTACDIYKQYKLFAAFNDRKLKCYSYISNIDSSVVREFKKNSINFQANVDLKDSLDNNLTDRELEILRLIGEGKSNKEISEVLFISVGTTKWHINNIFGKLEAKNRFEAMEKARRLNL